MPRNQKGGFLFSRSDPLTVLDLIEEWKSLQVISWIKGLPDPACVYASKLSNVNGVGLLVMDEDDILHKGVDSPIAACMIKRAAGLLAHLCYCTDTENLQRLFLSLGVIAFDAGREGDARIISQLNETVCRVIKCANVIVSWLDRPPFNQFKQYKTVSEWLWSVIKPLVQLIQGSRKDVSKNCSEIARQCYALSYYCNNIVRDWRDPLILCTAFIERTVLYLKPPAKDWGFDLHEDINGLMVISAIEYGSSADRCNKMQIGDEILAIDGQIVVGWHIKNIESLLRRRHSNQLSVLLKRRPCEFGNTYQKSQPPSPRLQRRADSTLDSSSPFNNSSIAANNMKQRHLSTSQGNLESISTQQHEARANLQSLLDGDRNRKKLTRRVTVCLGSPNLTRNSREIDHFFKRRTQIPKSYYGKKLRKLVVEPLASASSTGGSSNSLVLSNEATLPITSCTSSEEDDDEVFSQEPNSPMYKSVLESDVEFQTVECADDSALNVDRPVDAEWIAPCHNLTPTKQSPKFDRIEYVSHEQLSDLLTSIYSPADPDWITLAPLEKRPSQEIGKEDITPTVSCPPNTVDDSFSSFYCLPSHSQEKLSKIFGASPATPIISPSSTDSNLKVNCLSPSSTSPPILFQVRPKIPYVRSATTESGATSCGDSLLQELCTTPCAALQMPACRGFLYRCKLANEKGKDKWVRRFCVLHDAMLFIYKSEQDFMAEAVFYIPLFTVSPCEPEYRTRKKGVFKVTNKFFTLYLYSNDRDTCIRWMNKLGISAITKQSLLNFDPDSPGYYLSCAQSVYATLPRGRPHEILTHLRKSLRNAGHSGSRPRLSRESSTGSTASANSTDKVIDPLHRPRNHYSLSKRRPPINTNN